MRTQLVSACILLLAGSAWANAPWLEPISESSRNFSIAFARLNDYLNRHAQSKHSVSSSGREIFSVDEQLRAIKELVAADEFTDEKDESFRDLAVRLSKFELAPEKRCQFENVKALTSTVDFISDLDESAFRSEKRGNGLTAMILQYAKTLGGCFAELDKAWQEMITPEELEERHGDMKVFDISNRMRGSPYEGAFYDTSLFKAAEAMESETFAMLEPEAVLSMVESVVQDRYKKEHIKFSEHTGKTYPLRRPESEKLVQVALYEPCENLDDIKPTLEPVIKLAKLTGIPDNLRQDDGHLSLLLYASRYIGCNVIKKVPIREASVSLDVSREID